MIKKVDRPFLVGTLILILVGFFIFTSASTGLLARDGATFSSVTFNQIFLGLLPGLVAMYFFSKMHYKHLRAYSLYIFIASIIVTLLVFVPHIGFAHGGARRWITVLNVSFQPSEFLKYGFIIYFAAWLANTKDKVTSLKWGLLPFLTIIGIVGIILLKQPDTDTFAVTLFAGMGMFIIAGAKWRHIIALICMGALLLVLIAFMKPYVMQRIQTFLDPTRDSKGASYQIQQSLIAIGSGGIFGRGFGQSVQKFSFLPEPIGDSIFAVASEEFGFTGGIILIFLFLFFAFRGMKIALKTQDPFGRLLVAGIVILIVSQSFINIAAMLGILPLSGIPLSFVSHGGTALLFTLAGVGIILNVSRYQKP